MEKEVIEFSLYKGKLKGKFYPGSHAYYIDGKRKTGVTTFIGIKDKSRPLVIWATELYRDHLLKILAAGKKINQADVINGCTLHEERKQEAADIGSLVHDWIERYIKGEEPEMPEDRAVQIGVNAFLEWIAANKVKFLSSERVVYSKKHDYIGTMDIEAKVNGDLCLIDIKTSNSLKNDYLMQTAAYVMADQEESKRKYVGRWLIRLAKETESEYLQRMKEKNANRVAKGREPIVFPAYVPFEAMYLDDVKGALAYDFKAFLAAKELKRWDDATDFYKNKKA